MQEEEQPAALDVRILGPVKIYRDGRRLPLKPNGMPTRMLAALLHDAPEQVPVEDLDRRVWGHTADAHLRQKYATSIRAALAPGGHLLQEENHSYRLGIRREAIDAFRFRAEVDRAEAMAGRDPGGAATLLREAIGRWSGQPLAGLGDGWIETWRGELQRGRLRAVMRLNRIELARGVSEDLVAGLAGLHADHPDREDAAELYLMGLYALGEPGQAQEVFQKWTEHLRRHLDVPPTPGMVELNRLILARELDVSARLSAGSRPAPKPPAPKPPAVQPSEAAPAQPSEQPTPHISAVRTIPHELPPPLTIFVGRQAETTTFGAVAASPATLGCRLFVIDGQPGVGKTALATHWAHLVAEKYPDGQLFLDLQGFDPSETPLSREAALGRLLAGLGVDPREISPDLPGRVNQWRTAASGQRLLIVLDNAADAEQTGTLIPASSRSLVIVTSRRRLPGLGVRHGATFIPLAMPGTAEAAEILVRHLSGRASDTEAVQRLVRLCGRWPLALALVGAYAATRARRPLHEIADELAKDLGALDTGDSTPTINAVLEWSYRQLPAQAQRVFRMLSLHPGPELESRGVSALVGIDTRLADRTLDQLGDVRLVEEAQGNRFALHNLVSGYAATILDQNRGDTAAEQRREAVRRMLDYYLHSADHCASHLRAHRQALQLEPPAEGVRPAVVADEPAAIAWFTAERDVLLRLIRRAAGLGHPADAWKILATMADFLDWQGHWEDWRLAAESAAATARSAGDVHGTARAERSLGRALTQLGRLEAAEQHLRAALHGYRTDDDLDGQMRVHSDLGDLSLNRGQVQDALKESRTAYRLATAVGSEPDRATALDGMAWCHAELREYGAAADRSREALALHRSLGYTRGQAAALDTLGVTLCRLGECGEGRECLGSSLVLCRQSGDLSGQAEVLEHLGDCHHGSGDRTAARAAWREAHAILVRLRHPHIDQISRKLDDQPQATA
ncbi:AfsR/SARP family transcriptional regulator [Mangrovihabitans endophyticus]|uniref:SARP family transcriptional regulator n=1 Tax=Mangrovihabitans endophyticus TaxID=1751298 RepID=A0A8J3FTM5_9ACTN|nr:BTAD domain-containing putative transcriptional regulator [Mangrovihabitans endophyticus]GGL20765.1 SARP family transcriptional regulator [Mangrovihabitans endophyticus]